MDPLCPGWFEPRNPMSSLSLGPQLLLSLSGAQLRNPTSFQTQVELSSNIFIHFETKPSQARILSLLANFIDLSQLKLRQTCYTLTWVQICEKITKMVRFCPNRTDWVPIGPNWSNWVHSLEIPFILSPSRAQIRYPTCIQTRDQLRSDVPNCFKPELSQAQILSFLPSQVKPAKPKLFGLNQLGTLCLCLIN